MSELSQTQRSNTLKVGLIQHLCSAHCLWLLWFAERNELLILSKIPSLWSCLGAAFKILYVMPRCGSEFSYLEFLELSGHINSFHQI